jgi:3-phenylpropionate/trans-cinnamate dioxygenase ferredoxin reductase subunit
MHHQHVKYLLAGGGVAASAAAVAIRQRDAISPLVMVAQEITRPYHRSPLSKAYLLRRPRAVAASAERDELFTLPPDWFARHDVDLRTGRRVERIDVARRAATLDNGEEISYDALLLASGAAPRRLEISGADLPNLYYLRTLADAERLGNAVDKARVEGLRPAERNTAAGAAIAGGGAGAEWRGRAVVVGGGVLGVELAATLTQLGLGVDLIVGSRYPWQRFAGPTAGHAVARFLVARGVTVHSGCRAVALEGDGRVQRVRTDDGQLIACDFALAAVGSQFNRDLLRGTPIAAETAVLVDERCRSREAQIWAAGDCAAVLHPRFGKHRIVDHARHAAVTGTIAGINMTGGDARLGEGEFSEAATAADSWTTSLFDLTASVYGEGRLVYRRIVRGPALGERPVFAEIGIAADDRVAQVVCFGECPEVDALRSLVYERVSVSGIEAALTDPATALPMV